MIRRARNALRRLLGDAEPRTAEAVLYNAWLIQNGRTACTSALEDYLRERRFVSALAG